MLQILNSGALRDDCDVAVIGAGPYGLSVAAHLASAGVATRTFGDAMSFWRGQMPKGMKLRSPWNASHLADPQGALSLDSYVGERGEVRHEPLPLEDFVDYGAWFQRRAVPDLDLRKVVRVEAADPGFRLVLEDGDVVQARRVVVAMGLANQDFRPAPFDGQSESLVSHTSHHADLGVFRGKRVAVIGRGQSACESAGLMNTAGAEVELIARGDINWLGGAAGNAPSTLRRRLREHLSAPSAVGPFPLDWLVEWPGLLHVLPSDLRQTISRRSLRAGAASWVRPSFDGVTVRAGRQVVDLKIAGPRVTLEFDEGQGVYDHVLLATGYRIDVARIGILAPVLLDRVVRVDGSPVLNAGFESSVPGLHFVGASAVGSFGPLMRFICGAGFAARAVTRAARGRRGTLTDGAPHAIRGADRAGAMSPRP